MALYPLLRYHADEAKGGIAGVLEAVLFARGDVRKVAIGTRLRTVRAEYVAMSLDDEDLVFVVVVVERYLLPFAFDFDDPHGEMRRALLHGNQPADGRLHLRRVGRLLLDCGKVSCDHVSL